MMHRLLHAVRARPLQRFWIGLHGASLIGMNYWSSDLDESGEMAVIRHVAAQLGSTTAPVVFDVGANVGKFSAACLAAFGDNATVHAFEPSQGTFDLLRANLGNTADDARLRLHQIGFSDQKREETLFSSEVGSTIASVHQLDRPIRPFKPEFSERIQLDTIDDFCAENMIMCIDFLKLDIEGHELHALQGASDMLRKKSIRFIQFEFGENNLTSRTYLLDFVNLLGDRYDMYRVVGNGLSPWRYEGGRSEIFATMNYFCAHRDWPVIASRSEGGSVV